MSYPKIETAVETEGCRLIRYHLFFTEYLAIQYALSINYEYEEARRLIFPVENRKKKCTFYILCESSGIWDEEHFKLNEYGVQDCLFDERDAAEYYAKNIDVPLDEIQTLKDENGNEVFSCVRGYVGREDWGMPHVDPEYEPEDEDD